MRDQVFFVDKRQSFLQVDAIAFCGHTQTTQNNKSVISLQYFKKEGRDQYDFWLEDKYQSFL